MKNVIIKKEYCSKLSLLETEVAIKFVKDNFERILAKRLNLTRVSAPLFVFPKTGLNDNLSGIERPVKFDIFGIKEEVEIVQSLAKWKRNALKKYDFKDNTGLYTDMNAIRRDEEVDSIHSVYVDQWDWEKVIVENERNFQYLQETVDSIYDSILETQNLVNDKWPQVAQTLPSKIKYLSTSELEEMYPKLSRKERENKACQKYKSLFLYQIGWPLKDGIAHDSRASDYDDWNLNGDILLWFDTLGIALELSSMGIRVNAESFVKQVQYKNEEFKLYSPYGKDLLSSKLPLTIGGGIGQSRLCMFFLKKAHIGEVQVSVWDEEQIRLLEKNNIFLL